MVQVHAEEACSTSTNSNVCGAMPGISLQACEPVADVASCSLARRVAEASAPQDPSKLETTGENKDRGTHSNQKAQPSVYIQVSAIADEPRQVCVIGAGKAGLIASQRLHKHGISFDCYDKASRIGGLWVLNSDSGKSSAYDSLRINTSKFRTRFHNFPFPRHYPVYCSHQQIVAWLESYVAHFGFGHHIRLGTEVTAVQPFPGGGFGVTTVDNATGHAVVRVYAAVIVASGHHWDPLWPAWPGRFDGAMTHSHHYRSPAPFAGKRVLVVGVGNSGMDIATEVSGVAARVWLASRRGAHVLPRYFCGCVPLDALMPAGMGACLPFAGRQALVEAAMACVRCARSQASLGLPAPAHRILQAHPTISPGTGDVLAACRAGRIQPCPGIARLDGAIVHFTDGTSEIVDAIVCATGYNVTCPFLSPEAAPVVGGASRLLRNVVHPRVPGLFFVGFVQAHGAMVPCCEAQVAWLVDVLQGRVDLPPTATMEALIKQQNSFVRATFTASARHALMVDFHAYMYELRMARCPKGKDRLGRALWRASTWASVALLQRLVVD